MTAEAASLDRRPRPVRGDSSPAESSVSCRRRLPLAMDWPQGNVYSTDPDCPLLEKMLRIATRLEARVVSDRNEVYGSVEGGVE